MRLALLSIYIIINLNCLYGQCDKENPTKCEIVLCQISQLPNEKAFDNVIAFFIEEEDYKEALHYLNQKILYHPESVHWRKEKHPDDEYELKEIIESKLVNSKSCGCILPERAEWISSEGPLGADATAFLKDSRGNYWLGTGSSGGVYFSNNKGKSWEMRNQGIGPWHIYAIAESNDTIFIQVDYPRGLYGGWESNSKFYYWTDVNQSWKFISAKHEAPGPTNKLYANTLTKFKSNTKLPSNLEFNYTWENGAKYAYADIEYYQDRGVIPYAYLNWQGIYNEGYASEGTRYTNDSMRLFGFKETNEKIAKLNENFPRDMFYNGSGNYYNLGKGDGILLSRSGPYLMKKSKKISPLSDRGLVATDVRQLITSHDGKTYALVNESDIWMFDGEWHHVFNAYEQHLKMENPISDKGYDTKIMTIQADNSILFSFCGELWQLKDGKSKKIEINIAKIVRNWENTDYCKSIVQCATKDKDNNLYVVYMIYKYQNIEFDYQEEEVDSDVLLIKIDSNQNIQLYDKLTGYGADHMFVFTDYEGNAWVNSLKELKMINDSEGISNLHTRWVKAVPTIAFSNSGKIAFYDGKIKEWDPKKKAWSTITVRTNLSYVSSVGYDNKDNLYLGTGRIYQPSCGYDEYTGKSLGLYKLNEKGEAEPILNGPNTWIYSICPNDKYGLAVGTSGSGVQFLKTK